MLKFFYVSSLVAPIPVKSFKIEPAAETGLLQGTGESMRTLWTLVEIKGFLQLL